MSNWTYVAAIFRIESYHRKLDFEALFGKVLNAWDSRTEWDEAVSHPEMLLPHDSYRTLKMTVWLNPIQNHIGAYTVSIFGDLMDYNNTDEIIRWFDEKCAQLNVYQAAITIDNELSGIQTKNYYA